MEKPISGFEAYTISEDGTVKNTITGKRKTPTSNQTGKGYEYVDLYFKGIRKRKYIHRLVAEAFIPNPNRNPYVNHIDGNSHNNVASNLEWCTPLENVEHASKTIKTTNADEIVKALHALRDGVHDDGLLQMAGKQAVLACAADLIESLQAQLVESEMQLKVVTNELCNLCHTYADFDGCKTDCLNCDRLRGPQEAGKERRNE